MISEADLTHDAFLGGRVHAWQPRQGYRAATDPVLLAAACPAQAGERVLELGCGVGVAALCLGARVPGVRVCGVERQAEYAQIARKNGLDVVTADLCDLPGEIRQQSFDHVIANPPYFGPGTAARDVGREGANRIDTPLADWIATARARLKPSGWLTMIHLAEALPAILTELAGFGSVTALPLAPREGRNAGRIVVRARKGGRGKFTLKAPIFVHEGPRHLRDGDDYSAAIRAVLRDAAPLDFG